MLPPSADGPQRTSGSAVAPSRSCAQELDLLRAVVETLPVGVTVNDRDGRCLLANAAALELARRCDASALETSLATATVGDETVTVATSINLSAHKRLADELFTRAYMDELTGLPNRALGEQSALHLIETLEAGERFALAFVDLDNFKHINDFYSHAVGDALLVKVAERLSLLMRGTDMLARIGGDEFVLLLTPVGDAASLQAQIDALTQRLKQPFFIEGYEIFISASVGVGLYPDHGATYDLLRRSADSAMYRVKSGVKGGAIMFDESMRQAATGRMAIEQRFRLAVRDRRFCCAYQPKVDIRTHEVVGLEVLLRWRDEQGVIQAPGDFVAIAIELGLINEITHLVLAEVVDSLDVIDALFGKHVTISLNVAAKQAEDVAFMASYIEALGNTGCPRRFMIELTEEAFFKKSRFESNVLPRLRAIGVKVSIDDFGVGYSSLSALADITADELKIDRSFITDIHLRPRNQLVLRAIESLGISLGISVIAEGVETAEELLWLQASTGIRQAQGYYFSKPTLLPQLREGGFDFATRPPPMPRQHVAPRLAVLRAS